MTRSPVRHRLEQAPRTRRIPFVRSPGFWLVAVTFVVAAGNLRLSGCADNVPHRLLPLALIRHGALTLDSYRHALTLPDGSLPYYVAEVGGHIASIYPPVAGLVAVPVYAIPALLWTDLPLLLLEKISAGLMAAVSVGFVYGAFRRLEVRAPTATVLAGVYGLGTPVLSVASQSLCQHPAAVLFVSATIYGAVRARDDYRWLGAAGFAAGLAVASRPQAFAALAPVVAVVVWRTRSDRDKLDWAVAAFAAPLVALLAFNLAVYRSPAGGYAHISLPNAGFGSNPIEGAAGLLFSPGRGLFAYVPTALASAVGAVRAARRRDGLMLAAAGGIVLTVIVYATWDRWWGGETYGPRFLTDVAPLMALLWVPALLGAGRRGWAWFCAVAVVSVVLQLVGTYAYPCSWNRHPVPVDERPSRTWDASDDPVGRCLSEGFYVGGSQDTWYLFRARSVEP